MSSCASFLRGPSVVSTAVVRPVRVYPPRSRGWRQTAVHPCDHVRNGGELDPSAAGDAARSGPVRLTTAARPYSQQASEAGPAGDVVSLDISERAPRPALRGTQNGAFDVPPVA